MSIFEESSSIRRTVRLLGGGGGGSIPDPWHFTNCGMIGTTGPTQAQTDAFYLNSNMQGLVTVVTDGFQNFTVPFDGVYLLEAYGAIGGTGKLTDGGLGVYAKGSVELIAGTVLVICCGQKGGNSTNTNNYASGGGGGMSLVADTLDDSEPLICAGGGGGGAYYSVSTCNGVITTSGQAGYYGTFGVGGIDGLGGDKGQYGAGGAGYKGAGVDGNSDGGDPYIGYDLVGGAGYDSTFGSGGFGGGGGAYAGAGGAGGYSGGGAGGYSTYSGVGGGGGSYVHAKLFDTALVASSNTGVGFVTITVLSLSGGEGGLLIPSRKVMRL